VLTTLENLESSARKFINSGSQGELGEFEIYTGNSSDADIKMTQSETHNKRRVTLCGYRPSGGTCVNCW